MHIFRPGLPGYTSALHWRQPAIQVMGNGGGPERTVERIGTAMHHVGTRSRPPGRSLNERGKESTFVQNSTQYLCCSRSRTPRGSIYAVCVCMHAPCTSEKSLECDLSDAANLSSRNSPYNIRMYYAPPASARSVY